MLKLFRAGFANTNKTLKLVGILFFIDIFFLVVTGILSLDWIPSQIGAKVIVLHYDVFKIVRAVPELLKFLTEIFIICAATSLARDYMATGSLRTQDMIKNGKKYYFQMAVLTLAWFMAVMIPVSAGFLLMNAVSFNIVSMILLAVIAIAITAVITMFFFSPFIIVFEDVPARKAIRMSFSLTRNNLVRTLSFIGLYLLITVSFYILAGSVIGIYVGIVEHFTNSIKLGAFSKFSVEAIMCLANRYIYMAGLFASAMFYTSLGKK